MLTAPVRGPDRGATIGGCEDPAIGCRIPVPSSGTRPLARSGPRNAA